MSELFQQAIFQLNGLRNAVPHNDRITSDESGVLMAMAIAIRADCTRRRVGAVIVDATGRVVGTGRNGAAAGRPGCLSAGACPRGRLSYDDVPLGSSYSNGPGNCIALHAEINALLYSASPQARAGGTIYVTDIPCLECDKQLLGSGLSRAVWPEQAGMEWVLREHDLTSMEGIHA